MTIFKTTATALAFVCAAGISSAASLFGTFDVTAVNVTNLDRSESRAIMSNFDAAMAGTLGNPSTDANPSVYSMDTFVWEGFLDFRVAQPIRADYSVRDWFTEKSLGGAATSGVATGLDDPFGSKQLSFPVLNRGDAITTFFLFERRGTLGAGTFDVTHDDGITIYDDGAFRASTVGGSDFPTREKDSTVTGFDGGAFTLLYVATNGNPSILEVDYTETPAAVPLPAGLPLLLAGLGAFAVVARKRRAAA